MNTFNKQFNAFIKDKHLNLVTVAKDMDLKNASKLHAIAKGKRSMTVEELKKFCEVTNTEVDDLIYYKN